MRLSALVIIGFIATGGAVAQAAPRTATAVPLDSEATVDGVGVGCTGIGQSKAEPRWLTYSARIEFSNPARELLANEAVTIFGPAGRPLVSVTCEGPWMLFKLPPGAYRAEAWLPGPPTPPAAAAFRVPATGQARLELRFPSR